MFTVIFNGEEWLFDTINRARKIANLLFKRGYKYVRVFKYPTKELMYLANKQDKKVVFKNFYNEQERFEQPIHIEDTHAYKNESGVSRLSLLSKPKKKIKRSSEDHKKVMAILEKRGQLSLDLFPRR